MLYGGYQPKQKRPENMPEYEECIKALEQQPSEDCVSRKEVLQMIENIQNAGGFIGYHTYSEAFDRVDNMPPVTPTQRWIPIVTRKPTEEEKKDYFEQNGEELCFMIVSPMPNNRQEVLVSGGGCVAEDVFDEDFYNFENWDIQNVEAWMPLPDPYKE